MLGNLGLLGQGTESLSGELELHATDTLRLDIDRKRAAGLHIRVTPIVSGFGAASGEVAYSTHRRKISCLVTDMRVSWIGGNGKCPYVFRVFIFFSSISRMLQESVLIGFYFLTLLYSVIVHEVSHGVMALWLGDTTAKYADRLNLNPIKHIDPFGSVLLPALLILTTGSAFGWAKPVPYNPYNLKDQKWGPLWVALAGPGSNLLAATLAAIAAHMLPLASLAKQDIVTRFIQAVYGSGSFLDRFGLFAEAISGSFPQVLFGLLLVIIFWNVVLACFNLLPFPPLDGSKLLYVLFPIREETKIWLERYGIFFLLFAIFFLAVPISLFINFVLSFFVRLAF